MRADRAKQLLKNGVYRTLGETVSGVGALDGESDRTLRILMYHKVNDLWPNPTTVPTAVFEEQMTLLGELGYVPVSLDAVRDHYVSEGAASATCRPHHLRRRLSRQPRERASRPAAARLSGGSLRPDRLSRRRSTAPARGVAARARRPQRDARLGRARRARGRRHPDRVARHRAPAALGARAGRGDA